MHPSPHTIAQAQAHAITLGLQRIDAQMLMLHVLNQPEGGRAWLIAHDTDLLTPEQDHRYAALSARRAAGEPVAYLTGVKEFYGLTLHIDARVLDPRADTETLVDWALYILASCFAPSVADLGTGSGAVSLAIQKNCPSAQVWAFDASADALAVAHRNAQHLGLPVRCIASNWLIPHTHQPYHLLPAPEHASAAASLGLFDVVVSNPPYIAANDPHLIDLTYEPQQALVSGQDGLDDIRTIIAQATQHLVPHGWLLLEHGHNQASAVHDLLLQHGYTQVQSRKDLAGITRCTGGQWLGT